MNAKTKAFALGLLLSPALVAGVVVAQNKQVESTLGMILIDLNSGTQAHYACAPLGTKPAPAKPSVAPPPKPKELSL